MNKFGEFPFNSIRTIVGQVMAHDTPFTDHMAADSALDRVQNGRVVIDFEGDQARLVSVEDLGDELPVSAHRTAVQQYLEEIRTGVRDAAGNLVAADDADATGDADAAVDPAENGGDPGQGIDL